SARARCASSRTASTKGDERIRTMTIRSLMSRGPAALLLLLSISALHAQAPAPTTSSTTRPYVETLASEGFGGGEAGSKGEQQAGDYIAAQLARLGARPLPGRQDVFMPFDFTAGSRDGGSQLSTGSQRFSAPADIVALSFSDD